MEMFSKLLTQSDIGRRLALPTKCLKYLPCFRKGHALDFHVKDENEQTWTFRCIIRKKNHPKPVLSKGWSKFASAKHLDVGDKIIFYKQQDDDEASSGAILYRIEVKKSIKLFRTIVGYTP